jgi:hypothetical protein
MPSSRPRWPVVVLSTLLTAELLFAGVVVTRTPEPMAPPAAAAVGAAPGGQREVTLVSLGGIATDPLLRRVADELDAAVDAVELFWGPEWPHEVVIVAAGSDAEFRAQATGVADTSHIAAVTVADSVNPQENSATGQRIVFAPGAVTMSPEALRLVLTHELFHYAARASTAADAPSWITEGVADYVARPTPVGADARWPLPVALPSDADFGAPGDPSLAYDRAWLFARYLADRYGAPALRAFYVRAAGPHHPDPDTALWEVLRVRPADALRGWQQWCVRNGLA